MEIRKVNFSIWISPDKGGKNFDNDKEVEALLKDISKVVTDKGFYMQEEMCGKNPSMVIFYE